MTDYQSNLEELLAVVEAACAPLPNWRHQSGPLPSVGLATDELARSHDELNARLDARYEAQGSCGPRKASIGWGVYADMGKGEALAQLRARQARRCS